MTNCPLTRMKLGFENLEREKRQDLTYIKTQINTDHHQISFIYFLICMNSLNPRYPCSILGIKFSLFDKLKNNTVSDMYTD
jgi:hypothetical protein